MIKQSCGKRKTKSPWKEGVSVNRFIAAAVAEKLAALNSAAFFPKNEIARRFRRVPARHGPPRRLAAQGGQ
jgi:hypothetical protein